MTDEGDGQIRRWVASILAVVLVGVALFYFIRTGFADTGMLWSLLGFAVAVLLVGMTSTGGDADEASTERAVARVGTGLAIGLLGVLLGVLSLGSGGSFILSWSAIAVTAIGAAWAASPGQAAG